MVIFDTDVIRAHSNNLELVNIFDHTIYVKFLLELLLPPDVSFTMGKCYYLV